MKSTKPAPITVKRSGTTIYERESIELTVKESDGAIHGVAIRAVGENRAPLPLTPDEAENVLGLLALIFQKEASDDG